MARQNKTIKYLVNGGLSFNNTASYFHHRYVEAYYIGLREIDGEHIYGLLKDAIPEDSNFEIVEYKDRYFLKYPIDPEVISKFVAGKYSQMYNKEVINKCFWPFTKQFKEGRISPFFANVYSVVTGDEEYRKFLSDLYYGDTKNTWRIKELDSIINWEEEIYDYDSAETTVGPVQTD